MYFPVYFPVYIPVYFPSVLLLPDDCKRFQLHLSWLPFAQGGCDQRHAHAVRQMCLSKFAQLKSCVQRRCLVVCTSHALSSQALVGGCRFLTSISLLGAPHLSNAALMAIAGNANLHTFGLEGEVFPARRAKL